MTGLLFRILQLSKLRHKVIQLMGNGVGSGIQDFSFVFLRVKILN
jgi:hypothetical protein